ncbi:MAG: ADP-dependent phosphofructokinase/glucokinaselike protein [Herbinix sp.]|nr:ADP-dependent phosphofructokinase/glucokinaselike protein [Herbinix sp.]
MPYLDKYKLYLEDLPQCLDTADKTGHYTVFGYTSDLDILMKWDIHKFNQMIADYLVDQPRTQEHDYICDVRSFARIVSYYVIHGLGGEINVTDIRVCEYLQSLFETYPALGGTCAQGAAALGALGVPLVAHITDRSNAVCEFMNYPKLSIFSKGELLPASRAASKEAPVCHMILQYNKGDIVLIGGEKYVIPVSNRLILDYDHIHSHLPVDPEFLIYCEQNADKFYSYNISGFNAITDLEVLKKRVAELKAHYFKFKGRNPDCRIYFEGAHYLNSACKDYVFLALSECIDILGMNGEELVDLCKEQGRMVNEDNLESVLSGLELVRSAYPVKGIVMHTKDYSMYYGEKVEKANIEKGLTLGNLMSGTKARIGRYGSYQDCEESLELPLSPVGMKLAQELEELTVETKRVSTSDFERPHGRKIVSMGMENNFTSDIKLPSGRMTDNGNQFVCLVPSRYMEHPVDTIGLGDTFVAGMQLGFLH